MRDASQAGTRPPCRGRSAVPVGPARIRLAWHTGSGRQIAETSRTNGRFRPPAAHGGPGEDGGTEIASSSAPRSESARLHAAPLMIGARHEREDAARTACILAL